MRFCRFSAPSCAILALPCGGLSFFPHTDRAVLSFFCTQLCDFGPPCGGLSFSRTPIVRFCRFSALCCAILATPAGGCRFPAPRSCGFVVFLHPAVRFWPPSAGGCRFFRPPIVRLFSSPRKRGLQKQQTRLFPSFDLTYRILCLNLRKRK